MSKPKNIILITVDEWRADHLGCMGHPLVKTPNIDRLAAEGIVFENANCVSPLCVPSRTSMFTGQYVNTNRSLFFRPSDHVNSTRGSGFVEALKSNGYKIGIAGKNHAFTDEYFDKWFDFREEYSHWGKMHGHITEADRKVAAYRHDEKREYFSNLTDDFDVMQEGLIEDPEPFAEKECISSRIADDAINFLDQYQEDPFFLYFSFPDPHWPHLVCEPYFSMYNPDDVQDVEAMELDWNSHPFAHYVQAHVNGFESYSLEDRRKIVAVYFGMITFVDKAIGRVMNRLKELGLEKDTLVVFTADHGCYGGRYGMVGKTKGFQEPLVQIPLIIKGDGIQPRRTEAMVSNIDFLPTLFECIGLPPVRCAQGGSFLEVLHGESNVYRKEVFAEGGRPIDPPPVIPIEEYDEYRNRCKEKDGPRWFLDYTCNGRAAMIKTDRWKYCYYVGDRPELYDLKNDPQERNNLVGFEEHAGVREDLRNRLMDWVLTQPQLPYDEESSSDF
jgi:arylsulfatase A-like enzyme